MTDTDDQLLHEPTQPAPTCCDHVMTMIRYGRRAHFAIWLWRCATCERFETTTRRYDSQNFWVGAMGNAIYAKINELIEDAYTERTPR